VLGDSGSGASLIVEWTRLICIESRNTWAWRILILRQERVNPTLEQRLIDERFDVNDSTQISKDKSGRKN